MRTMTTSIWSLAFLVTVFLVLACDVTHAVSTTPPPAPTGDATQEVTKVPTDTVTADPTSPPTLTAWTSPPSATGFSTAPSDPSQNPTDTSTSLTSGAVTSPVTSPPQTKASTDAPFTSPVTVSPNASTRAPTTKAPPATPPPCIISASALASLVQPTYTFDATAAVRVVPALTRALTCNLPSNVYWRVAARAVVTAPYLVLSAGVLSLGTYRCSVSFIIPATQVNVTVPFTITVFEPVPVVKISGGNQTIKYNTPLSIVVAIKSGTIKTWAWSCCAVASNFCFATSCSMLMSYADGFVVGRLLTVLSANSEYRVTVTAKTQGGQTCNDSIAVDVLSSAVNTVSLTASPTGPVYLNDTLFLIARPKLRFSVFNWSVTMGDAVVTPIAKWGNAVAMVRPRSIGTLVVSVTATDPNHVQGTSAINMAVRALPTGTCAVTSTDSIIVGGSSPVTITLTQWSGTSDAKFRFGYVRRTGNRVTLSPDYGLNRNMTVTAPLLVPAGAVAFYVESSEGNVAVWCTAFVASMSDLSGLIADRTTDMQSSLSSDDVGALMRSVMDLMSALKASNVSDAAVFAAGNQILAGISTVLRADPAYLTTTLKGQAVDALTEYYDFVNRTARGADVTLQTNIVYALAAVFSTTNSSQDVDVSSHATALALIVDQLNATTLALTQTARQAKKILAQQLALCVAAQLDLGDTINVTSDTLTISAARLPASQIGGFDGSGATFNSTGGTASIRVPLGALAIGLNTSIDDDALLDAEISVSATVHGMNPVPTAAVAAGKTLSGAIVEFDVAASGGDFSAGLTVEITVGLRSSPNATCVFFDSTLNAWSTSGVTTIGYDDFTGQLLCNTSHLSLFTGTVDSLAPTTTIRPIPTATPTTTTTTVATSPTSSADPTSDTQTTSSPNSGGTTPPATTTPAPWHMSTTTASPATSEQTGVPSSSSDDGPLGPLSTVSIAIIVTVVIILVIVGVISVIIIVKLRRPVKKSSEAALSKRAKDYGVKDDVPVSIEAHQPSPSPPPPPAVPASATPTSQPPLGQSSIALSGREALKETKAFPDGV